MTVWTAVGLLFVLAVSPVEARRGRAEPARDDKIAFTSLRPGSGSGQIWVMGADGSHPAQVTFFEANLSDPAWSPDGTRIAFSGDDAVWIMDADGTDPARVTSALIGAAEPAWSPDGTRIAFVVSRGASGDVWVMDADGTNLTPLTSSGSQTGMFNSRPAWAPDGTRIAFTSGGPGRRDDVWVMDADGSDATNVTEGIGGTDAAWSPDGRRIAFTSAHSGSHQIWIMEADGTDPHPLFEDPGAFGVEPTWSPDGKRIAFRGIGQEIRVINADGSAATPTGSFGAHPAWRPVVDQAPAPPDPDGRVPRCFGQPATVVGTERNDVVVLEAGREARDIVVTLGGDDTVRVEGISGDGLADLICTGDGGDSVSVGEDELMVCQPVRVDLGGGNDRFRGPIDWQTSVSSPHRLGRICPEAGSTVLGGPGDDLLHGGDGDDQLIGGPGDDQLIGWYGNDDVSGEAGDDTLDGAGTYFVEHEEGADPDTGFTQILKSPGDVDTCAGGPGDDTFERCDSTDEATKTDIRSTKASGRQTPALEGRAPGILRTFLNSWLFTSWF